ncbi:extracellular solute-binding protein [Rhodovulum sp. DZ06]|uniref:extracellular solute-binding protein n=1 Tax=Rhodovulum sp. DZ06 TaxID=3425126 RepID=UPI003D32C9DA
MHARRRAPLATAAAGLAAALLAAAAPAAAEDTAESVIVSHGISSFGDLKYPADFPHFDYVNPDAPKGGRWSGRGTSASNTFDSLNPFILKGEAAQGLGLTLGSILVGSADEADSAYCLMCTTLEYPEDRSWVIFNLRDDVTFSDGSALTADDVVFSLETLKEKGAPGLRLNLRDITGAEALSPTRVKFTFAEGASNRDLPAVAGGLSILSRAWWAERDFEDSTLEPILGAGPYVVADVKPGRSITYKRREDYWAAAHPAMIGTWNFDEIIFEYFKDYTASFEAFKGGAFLFHEEFFSKIWATGYDFPALDKGWVKRDMLPDGSPSGTQGFWFNTRRPQFQDPRVREALAMAFDFEWSNEKLFYGLYDRTVSFFQNSPMAAEGMPSEAELALLEPLRAHLPESVFTDPAYMPPVTKARGRLDRRLQKQALDLLEAAGWTVGPDRLLHNAAGETLRVEFLDDSPTFERIIGPYVKNLRQLGVDASLRVVDASQYQARVEEFDYDVVPGRFTMSLTPGPALRALFHSASVDQAGTPNLTGISNPAVDALVETMIKADSRAALNTAGKALDRVLRSLHIWTPNWYKATHNVAYWDVFGRPETKPPYARGVMPFWWWDAEKAAKLEAEGAL